MCFVGYMDCHQLLYINDVKSDKIKTEIECVWLDPWIATNIQVSNSRGKEMGTWKKLKK